jgi:hypothetical protein
MQLFEEVLRKQRSWKIVKTGQPADVVVGTSHALEELF